MTETATGFVLLLVIGDPAHYEMTDDVNRDIYGPIWDWMTSFKPGQWPGSAEGDHLRYVGHDIRWDGEHAQLLMLDTHTSFAFWWTPPTPPPAQLMQYAQRITRSGQPEHTTP